MGASRVKDLPRAVTQSKHTLAAARWPSLLVPETKWLDQWAAAAAVCMIFARFSAHRPRHIYRCFNRPRRLIGLRTATHFTTRELSQRCIEIPYCSGGALVLGW